MSEHRDDRPADTPQQTTPSAASPAPGNAPSDKPPPNGSAPDKQGSPGNAPDEEQHGRRLPRPVLAGAAIIGVLALVALVLFLSDAAGYAFTHQTTDDAKIDADSSTVTSKIAERVDDILTDTNRYVRRGQLLVVLDDRDERSRLAAAIASRNAADAQVQQARQNLLLAQSTTQTESLQRRGSLEAARADVRSATDTFAANARQADALRAGVSQAMAQLRAAQAALPGARASEQRAAFDLARDSALVQTGDVDESQVDADRAAYETALSQERADQADVVSAQDQIVVAQKRLRAADEQSSASAATIGTQRGNVVTAQGQLEQARLPYRITTQQAALTAAERQRQLQDAQVRLARDQLAYTRIVSPVDGTVAAKTIAVGQTISPGQPLFTIVPAQSLYITANYKETQLNLMRVGQPVDIHIDSYPEFAYVGHVAEFNPAAQNEFAILPPQNSSGNFVKVTQRVPIRIYVDRGGDDRHPLRPGMSVETSVRVR